MDEAARRAWKARLGPQLRVHRAPRLHALAGALEALHAALAPRPDGVDGDGDGDGGELGDGAWSGVSMLGGSSPKRSATTAS